MGVYSYPDALGEVTAWVTTEIRINGTVYEGVRAIAQPSVDQTIENVFGQGDVPVGWSPGRREPADGSMTMLAVSYDQMVLDIAGDLNANMLEFPLTIVVTYSPTSSKVYEKKIVTHNNVRIMSISPENTEEGTAAFEREIGLKFPRIPEIEVVPL